MEYALLLLTFQGLLGAFDTIYHHELTERLPWRITAGQELWLHGIRAFFYSVIFFSLAWVQWQGIWAWVLIVLMVIEIGITLWDFVVEDQTRKLPATERVTHTILAINYGAVLALLIPEIVRWSHLDSGFTLTEHGMFSWILTLYALGVLVWAVRDYVRSFRLKAMSHSKTVLPTILADIPHQKILVTGGTGMIGSRLCQSLVAEGHYVTILTRDPSLAASIIHGRVTLINQLDDLEEDQDIIINLAGAPISVRWTAEHKQQIEQSRFQTTQAIIRFIERSKVKPKTLISGSAIGIYGPHPSTQFDELSALAKSDFAASLCTQWESMAQVAHTHGVRVCLLRTGVVLGTHGGMLAQLLFSYEFGLGGKIGSGRQMLSWIHIDDLLGIISLCLRDESIRGPINGTAPHPVSNAEFSQALAHALNRPNIMTLPAFVIKSLFGEMGNTLLLQGQCVQPIKALSHGYTYQHPHIDGALHDLLGAQS